MKKKLPKKSTDSVQGTVSLAGFDFPRHDLFLVSGAFLVLVLIFYRKILSWSVMVFGTDWLAGGYPIRKFFFESGHSQWNPYLYGGLPHFSNSGDVYFPLTMVFSSLFPVHVYFAYLFIVLTFIAGIFAYLFLKKLKLSFWPSFLGGLSYMFTGILVSYVYGGHEGRMAIVAFLPVVMFYIHVATEKKTLASFLLAGLSLGFILLIPHVQMNYYLLILVFFYFLFRLWGIFKESRSWGRVVKLLSYFAIFLAAGFLLSAVLYLPFYKYIPYSPRGGEEGRGYEFATSWPMNPEETINMAVPDFSGTSVGSSTYWGRNFFKLHSEYLGALAVFLAVLGIILGRRDKLIIFFVVMTVLTFTVAWGANTPLYKLYYNLVPGFKKFRAPSLIYFLIAFNLVALSAFGLQLVLDRLKSGQNVKSLIKSIIIMCGIVIGVTILVSLASSGFKSMLAGLIKDQPAKLSALDVNFPKFVGGMWKFTLLTIAITGILLALMKHKIKLMIAGVILVLLTVIDLWLVESKFIQTVPAPDVYYQADEVVKALQTDKSLFRIFPLQYRNDDYHMLHHIQSLAGEHGNQIQRYNEFLGAGKSSMVDYHNLFSNLNFLNLVNAKYIITQQSMGAPFFREVHRGNFIVYENVNVLPRAFAVSGYEVITDPAKILERIASPDFNPRQTVILEKEPDLKPKADTSLPEVPISRYEPSEIKLTVELSQPALVVLLDNYYPDWKAEVDGQPAEIYRADYTFRAVSVPAGRHEISFSFVPRYFYMGKTISLFSFFAVLIYLIGDWSFRKLRPKTSASFQ